MNVMCKVCKEEIEFSSGYHGYCGEECFDKDCDPHRGHTPLYDKWDEWSYGVEWE